MTTTTITMPMLEYVQPITTTSNGAYLKLQQSLIKEEGEGERYQIKAIRRKVVSILFQFRHIFDLNLYGKSREGGMCVAVW
jgi:hypothetical protein